MNENKALIIGSTGNLGSLLEKCLRKFFILDYCYKVDLKENSLGAGIICCSKTSKSFNLNNYDVVINCAWVAGASRQSLVDNINISKVLLNNSSKGAYFYLSSIDVYGENDVGCYTCSPRTLFSIYKLKVENSIFKINCQRKKFILRVGNFIPNEQIYADMDNIEFRKNVNFDKYSNLTSPELIADLINQLYSTVNLAKEFNIINVVLEPNCTWGELYSKYNTHIEKNKFKVSLKIHFHKNIVPYFYKYINIDGKIVRKLSLIPLNVFIKNLLNIFISKPDIKQRKLGSEIIAVNRSYQKYTLR